jgi:acyl transferase domain-containing protein/acyl carrier protein
MAAEHKIIFMNKNIVEPSDDAQRLKRAFIAIEKLQYKLKALEYARTEPIALIGMGCRFPGGANNPDAYWQLLRDGVDAISEVPADRWDVEAYYDPDWTKQGKINTRDSGFLNTKVYEFDPQFFGIAPRETLELDPQQRLLLEVAWDALEYANIVPDRLFSSSTGVFMGISTVDYAVRQLGMQKPSKIGAYMGTGALLSPAAGRLSYVLGLTGPSTIVDTACSSSLLAVHLGCQSLRNKESDLVLSGGVNLILDPELSSYFSTAGMLSPDGRCKTFDAAANGYVRSEGCGVIVLKRLSDALADGDNILALIRGSAVNQDGPSGGLTVPSGPSQEQVIKQALARGGLEPNQVDYIEAHGTGTALGDPIEVGALSAVFGKDRPQDRPLLIGSAKTNVGHMEAAAGMGGLIKVLLALQHEEIPPHLHFKQPSPRIPWEAFPVKVPTERTRWLPSADKRRIAGISSFGFSGTNAHVIVEEAPKSLNKEQKSADNRRPVHLLTLSAKSEAALKELAGRYEKYLSDSVANFVQHKERDLGDVCFTVNTCRSHFQHRLSVVASSFAQMREKLAAFIAGQEMEGICAGKETTQFRIAFLFAGQGSQYVGMGRQLYDTNATFRQCIVRCDEILRPWLTKPLLEVLYNVLYNKSRADNALLNETVYTQPALFALEYALAQLWKSWGIEPSVVMGHSVGEYVAACVAGVFSLEEGLKLIAERARLMYNLPRDGEMVTVFASEERVATAIQSYTQQVSIAALNGPENIVISGQRDAINMIVSTFEADGIKTKPLKVSHAFHSPLIEPMLSDFERVAKEITFSPPQIDLISNLTGELATADITTPDYWCHHIRQPVKFAASMETLYQQGDEVLFVEIGPRQALLGMGRQCLPENVGVWLPSLRHGQEDWQQILQSLGELYVRGASVNWSGFDQDYQRHRLILPTYPFQRKRYCIERPTSNARKRFLPHEKLHPLIDKKIQSPLIKETLFESDFHTDELPLLADHLVYDKVVVSGASHVSLILGATEITFGTKGCVLEEIFFQHALFVPDEGRTVQLAITQNDDAGDASFKLISFGTNTEVWTTHVTGKILSTQLPTTNEPLPVTRFQAAWDRCEQTVTAAEFYQTQLERHIYLGPHYQWVESIRRGNGEAVCQINLPKEVTDAYEYQLPPGLIDACFGLLAVAVEMVVPDTFIPFSIEKLDFLKRPRDFFQLQAHVQLRPESDENRLVGDIRLFEKTTGQVIAQFIGFEGRKATIDRLLSEYQLDFTDWFYEIAWQPKPLKLEQTQQPVQEKSGHWLIFADQTGIGLALAERLQKRGEFCTIVNSGKSYEKAADGRYYVNPAEPLDFQLLLKENLGDNRLRGVVHLWSLDGSVADLHHAQRVGCASVMLMVQSLVENSWAQFPHLWLVTRGGQAVDAMQPQQTSVWGLGRVIALEHPELGCVCLDLDPSSEDNTQTLFNELWYHDTEVQIAWRSNIRHIARWERCSLPPSANPFSIHDNSSYLISGGTGALGLQVAQWLVKQGARYLLLLSRSGISSSAAQEMIGQMEQTGANILIIKVDVADQSALNQALDKVPATMPPLRGVIHAAGVLDDGMLMGQNWDRFENVMAPKVYGAWNLHQRTADMELDFFVMFSSVASLLGNQGQSNYAAANAFLDGLAHYRRNHGLVATSINWGSWENVAGMAASTSADNRLSKQGFKAIHSEKGLAVLEKILTANVTQIGVVPCDWHKYFSQLTSEQALFANWQKQEEQPTKSAEFLQNFEKARPDEKHTILVNFVAETAHQVIGIDTSDTLDIDKPLMELGMDSLMAVEIRNRLGKDLDTSLPVSLLFNYPTVNELVKYLEQKVIKSDNEHDHPEKTQSDENFDYLDGLNPNELEELINRELESD